MLVFIPDSDEAIKKKTEGDYILLDELKEDLGICGKKTDGYFNINAVLKFKNI